MPPDLDPASLRRFAGLLDSTRRVRIPRATLWAAFAEAFPNRPQGPEEREWFLGALKEMEAQGRLRLPSPNGQGWDRSAVPPTPMFAQLVRTSAPRGVPKWKTFPWHPRLSWVPDLPYLNDGHWDFLQRVHEGLVADRFREPAPLKYRSLQLTGVEKRLEELVRTELFRPGRLDLRLLGCSAEILPMAWEQVSNKPGLIVFENAGPFAVARTVLLGMEDPPYGMVGFGGGKAFLSSVRHLATLDLRIGSISYVGDLDPEGLMIPQEAARIAASTGLPPILPATELHRATLASAGALGRPLGWAGFSRPVQAKLERVLLFLEDGLRAQVGEILRQGNRIPEEVLGPEEMRRAWDRLETQATSRHDHLAAEFGSQ